MRTVYSLNLHSVSTCFMCPFKYSLGRSKRQVLLYNECTVQIINNSFSVNILSKLFNSFIFIKTECYNICMQSKLRTYNSKIIKNPSVSSTNKTECHDITEILLKVTLNTTKQTNNNSLGSPHDEHRSSIPRPVKLCSVQLIFQFLFRTIQK